MIATLATRGRGLVALAALALAACPGEPPPQPPPRHAPPPVEPGTPLPPPREDGRLPGLAVPERYALALDVDPSRERFSGSARIDVAVPARTSFVVLHGHELRVTSARARVGQQDFPARASTRLAHGGTTPEELVLAFDRPLPPGKATLELAWDAPFDDQLTGLYRVKDGERWYAFTQLESTFARRAFPCFDEPGFKVPFEVSVAVPRGLLAFGNGPEVAREDSPDRTTFRFAPTPPLPSYLVALAVGDFDVRESPRAASPPIRIVTTKGKSGLGELALEATGGLVDGLADWFGIPYPYAKLDVVAVPDFAAGAMENPGLVTFREELLLLDPSRASIRARRSQALVIAHELAHQWFGNLVTAAWWDDLWLNEGMATWMEWKVVDRWRPSFGARLDAVASAHGVMDLDSLASARAVRQPVTSTSEAREAFDGITYEKGAAVLSTIEAWVGPEAFQRGVRAYLTENAHKSVDAEKLLTALDRASGKDVTSMAAAFLDRPGVPEVSVALACERGARWHVELTQEPWRPLGSKKPEETDRAWTLPVCVRAEGETKDVCADLAAGAPSLVAGRGRCPAFVHPNAASSYYRFSLTDRDAARFAAARRQLDVTGRISLLSNAWASVRAGKLAPAALLKLLAAFDDEDARQVVDQVVAILHGVSDTLVEEEARPAFRKLVATRLSKHKRRLGWVPSKDATGDEAILRRTVLFAMGELAEDEATLREAEEHARRWLVDPTSVDADTAAVAVELASRRAGADRLEALRQVARTAKTREDRILALRAMAGFDDRAVLESALGLILTDEIHVHELRYVLGAALGRRGVREITDAWIRSHWSELRKRLPGSLSAGLVRAAAVPCTAAAVEETAAFYSPRAAEIEGAQRRLAEALESASLCAELRAQRAPALTRALLEPRR